MKFIEICQIDDFLQKKLQLIQAAHIVHQKQALTFWLKLTEEHFD